jgi:hypothetical protein
MMIRRSKGLWLSSAADHASRGTGRPTKVAFLVRQDPSQRARRCEHVMPCTLPQIIPRPPDQNDVTGRNLLPIRT